VYVTFLSVSSQETSKLSYLRSPFDRTLSAFVSRAINFPRKAVYQPLFFSGHNVRKALSHTTGLFLSSLLSSLPPPNAALSDKLSKVFRTQN
jgi:hypothetical protein